ncbi:MAG: L-threonylcarbamoyladenylate synthase [Desulfobacterales bacterium]
MNPRAPQPKMIARAVDILRGAGVVCFPTRCLYGLGADAFNTAAVERVFEIKQRPADLPLLVLISRADQLEELAAKVTPAARLLIERFWPGRLTLVLDARSEIPQRLTAGRGKIGVRLAAHPVARALVEGFGRPITGTSANPTGESGCRRIAELDPRIAAQVQLILDAGDLKGGVGSTVVDVTGESPVMIREGEVSRPEILAVIKSAFQVTCL